MDRDLKILIVCKSKHHENTWKVAKAIGDVLDAEIMKPDEDHNFSITDYDLLGLGSGIYWSRYHKNISKFVDNLPNVENKKAFIFSTSGLRRIPIINGYGKKIKKKLSKKGFETIGEFSCRGYDSFSYFKLVGGIHKGRPNEKDLKEAKEFAKNISEKMEKKSWSIGIWITKSLIFV